MGQMVGRETLQIFWVQHTYDKLWSRKFLKNLTQNIVLDFTWLYCTTCLKGDGLIIGSPETGDNSPASYKVVKGEGVG